MSKKSVDRSTQSESPSSASSNWNLPELLERLDNDHAFVGELLAVFRHDSQFALREAKQAFADGDFHGLEYKAHTLKGMFKNLLMNPAAHVAAALETAARQQDTQHSGALLTELDQTMQRLLPEVDARWARISI